MADIPAEGRSPTPAEIAFRTMAGAIMAESPDTDPVDALVATAMDVLAMALFVNLADPGDPEEVRAAVEEEVEATLLPRMRSMTNVFMGAQKARPC